MVASTDYEWRQAEEFTLQDCADCDVNEVRLDREWIIYGFLIKILVFFYVVPCLSPMSLIDNDVSSPTVHNRILPTYLVICIKEAFYAMTFLGFEWRLQLIVMRR